MGGTAATLASRRFPIFCEKLSVSIHKVQYIAEGMSKVTWFQEMVVQASSTTYALQSQGL
jgi:hypothetical protein